MNHVHRGQVQVRVVGATGPASPPSWGQRWDLRGDPAFHQPQGPTTPVPGPPPRSTGVRFTSSARSGASKRLDAPARSCDPSSHVVGASGGPWKHLETRCTGATRPKTGGVYGLRRYPLSGHNGSLGHEYIHILGDYYACRCPQDDVDWPQ